MQSTLRFDLIRFDFTFYFVFTAPPRPTDYEIQTKIIPKDNDDESTTEQYVIEIDLSLFSNEYGIVSDYVIYVRQDQNNFQTDPDFVGTYDEALKNSSMDYLAKISTVQIHNNKVRIIIGEETWCSQNYNPFIPCNGKLKSNRIYKLSSIAWIAVFPILALLIPSIVVMIWKRQELKRYCFKKQKKEDNTLKTVYLQPLALISLYENNFQEIKPKPLIQYINLTDEDKTIINNEFQHFKNLAPDSNQSIPSSPFDRYKDIPSRGPWKETAVHLTDIHRKHNYINANEIRSQCYPYIPMNKNETLDFNRIKIKVNNIEYYLDNQLEIRRLFVEKNNKQYNIVHFFFTNWPKYGIIICRTLIDLTEIVNQYDEESINLSSPIVVHCSSGTGRTGTYIAVDIITHLLDQSNQQLKTMKLDVMGIVNQLKHDRAKMVQTEQQYLLIHHCVEEYLRKTNRLDLIIKESNNYETIADRLPKLRERRYIDLSESKDNSKIDSSSIIDHVKNEDMNKNISERIENEQEFIDEHECDYVQQHYDYLDARQSIQK
ncbi:unnamed protein product [Rotaria sordida]|uniref:Uncharacterized protein n=1 Tax=Rotaria sordida TaxID=392033 RepID=A0A813YGL1_9BILA|nr:unnamed protein product [Rotaria sordida]CAF3674539.1 unnamed protein product [Rotaria sordida]